MLRKNGERSSICGALEISVKPAQPGRGGYNNENQDNRYGCPRYWRGKRRHLGLVLQDAFLFSGNIADNITLGDPRISEQHMLEASRRAHIASFIERLPARYQEEVQERGVTHSQGQRQLLSFARALAFDPRILILDEATSSVDTRTEGLIQEALRDLIEDRTALIIAHRLSTIKNVNRILVIHKGELREEGSHQELLARQGLYSRLYELQYQAQEHGGNGAPAPVG